jgi:hypothetical protein
VPFITSGSRRTGRLLAAVTGLALLAAAPAAQAGYKPKSERHAKSDVVPIAAPAPSSSAAANPLNCTPEPRPVKAFAAWDDLADYTLAPGGDIERHAPGWTLMGARVVDGNQPFDLGEGAGGETSLSLRGGSSAISAPICIDDSFPSFRFFARNTGDLSSGLKVEVLYMDVRGSLRSDGSGVYAVDDHDWGPSDSFGIDMTFAAENGAAPVAFRFTPQGRGGEWQIDDLYVDPMARR